MLPFTALAGKLKMGGADAKMAIGAVGNAVLLGGVDSVWQDVKAKAHQVRIALQRWVRYTVPMRPVHGGRQSSTAANRAVSSDTRNL